MPRENLGDPLCPGEGEWCALGLAGEPGDPLRAGEGVWRAGERCTWCNGLLPG